MEDILIYPENDYRDYLEHHGVPGQKWGVRKAAWYPISAFKAAKARAGEKIKSIKANHDKKVRAKKRAKNLEKARKARAEKLAQQKKDEELKRKFEEDKEKTLRTGTPADIIKLSPHLTTKELQDAVTRNQAMENLKNAEKKRLADIEEAEYQKKWGKVNSMIATARKFSDVASAGIDVYNKVQSVMDIINGEDKKSKTAPSISEILANPGKYTDAQINAAKQRQDNIDYIKNKAKGPKNTNIKDMLEHPENYSDSDWEAAAKRSSGMKNTKTFYNEFSGNKKPDTSTGDSENKNTKEQSAPKQTVEDMPRYNNHNDKNQRADFKSRVVDGDWTEIVTPQNVSTALSVIGKGIDTYQSIRSARSGQRLLEQKNYANLILDPGVDDDRRRR